MVRRRSFPPSPSPPLFSRAVQQLQRFREARTVSRIFSSVSSLMSLQTARLGCISPRQLVWRQLAETCCLKIQKPKMLTWRKRSGRMFFLNHGILSRSLCVKYESVQSRRSFAATRFSLQMTFIANSCRLFSGLWESFIYSGWSPNWCQWLQLEASFCLERV